MELLLNVVWVALALLAFGAFRRKRRVCAWTSQIPYRKALLALACMLVLLFPVVSASDDLHPTQAVLEDATKRIHRAVAPLQLVQSAPTGALPHLLEIYLLTILVTLFPAHPIFEESRLIFRERIPRDGRAPPSR